MKKQRYQCDYTVWICIFILLVIILGAIFCPVFSSFDYASQNVAFANRPAFSADSASGYLHILGTDSLGRDIYVRLWYGVRISMIIAVSVTFIDCFIGMVYGGISGYFGGITDHIMMRLVEVISGIPYLIILLLLMAVLPRGLPTIIVAYSLTGWTGMARLVRGQVLSLSRQEFIMAEKALGASSRRIILHHLLPNTAGIIIVSITLDIPNVIFTEAFLSLIGLGIEPPMSSLGIMANQGIQAFQTNPGQLFYPSILIVFISLAFNLLGDQLRDLFYANKRGQS